MLTFLRFFLLKASLRVNRDEHDMNLTKKSADLSTIFVGNCEDTDNCVTIFPDEVVDILGKDWLPNDGNLQVPCHDGPDADGWGETLCN